MENEYFINNLSVNKVKKQNRVLTDFSELNRRIKKSLTKL